nr:MAG TPA: hypothetical protein [Caudoviricetes sp.]
MIYILNLLNQVYISKFLYQSSHWRVQKYTIIGKYPSFYTLFN